MVGGVGVESGMYICVWLCVWEVFAGAQLDAAPFQVRDGMGVWVWVVMCGLYVCSGGL